MTLRIQVYLLRKSEHA